MDHHERVWASEFQRLFRRQEAVVLARLKGPRARQGTRHYSPPGTKQIDVNRIFARRTWDAGVRDVAESLLVDLYNEVGDSMFATYNPDGAFNVRNPEVARSIGSRVTKIVGINNTTEAAIRQALLEGEAAGDSIDGLQRRVRSVFTDATRRRAEMIARTEVVGAHNEAGFFSAKQTGQTLYKQWIATRDPRTRATHVHADRTIVGMDQMFAVGRALMPYPGYYGAPAEEIINCRCTLVYTPTPPRAATGRAPRQQTPKPEVPPDIFGNTRAKNMRDWGSWSKSIGTKRSEHLAFDGPGIEGFQVQATRVRFNGRPHIELKFKVRGDLADNLERRAYSGEGGWQREQFKIVRREADVVDLQHPGFTGEGTTYVKRTDFGGLRYSRSDHEFAFNQLVQVYVDETQWSPELMKTIMREHIGMADDLVRYTTDADVRNYAENALLELWEHRGSLFESTRRREALQGLADNFGLRPEDMVLRNTTDGRLELVVRPDAAKRVVRETGAELFIHGTYTHSIEDLANLLQSDRLASTTVRWSEGIGKAGMSSADDVRTGGADYVFTRQISRRAYEPRTQVAGTRASMAFRGDRLMQRTDWFAYTSDSFGRAHGSGAIGRQSLRNLKNATNYFGSQETMFRQAIPFDDLETIYVHQDIFDQLMRELAERGVTQIGGRPVADVVQAAR